MRAACGRAAPPSAPGGTTHDAAAPPSAEVPREAAGSVCSYEKEIFDWGVEETNPYHLSSDGEGPCPIAKAKRPPPAPRAPVSLQASPDDDRCDLSRSRALTRDAAWPSTADCQDTVLAAAEILEEACTGPLATIARVLRKERTFAEERDDDGAPCPSAAGKALLDARLLSVVGPLVPAACTAPRPPEPEPPADVTTMKDLERWTDVRAAELPRQACTLPPDLAHVFEGAIDRARAIRLARPRMLAWSLMIAPPGRFGLARAILDRDDTFTGRALAFHVLACGEREGRLRSEGGRKVCREEEGGE